MATIPKTKISKSNKKAARVKPAPVAPSTSVTIDKGITRRHEIKLTEEEENGIREILANPPPPTEELKARLKAYREYAAAHPDSGW